MQSFVYRTSFGDYRCADAALHRCPEPAFICRPVAAPSNVYPMELPHDPLRHGVVARAAVMMDGNPLRRTILEAISPSRRSRLYREWGDRRQRHPREAIREAILNAAARSPAGMVTSFSHDQYSRIVGGVQNVIRDEEDDLVCRGWTYLHLCPAFPLPLLAPLADLDTFGFTMTLNGEDFGTVAAADVLAVLWEERSRLPKIQGVIHHLLGQMPELLARFAALWTGPPIFWIHDFFSLCPSSALLRNDATFCHGPDKRSQGCTICAYGRDRLSHTERMAELFAALQPVVVAPSESALRLWRARSCYTHANTCVAPPARLKEGGAPVPRRAADAPVRVGYIGQPAYYKGWSIFRDLAAQHRGDSRYAFHLFGISDPKAENVVHVPTEVTRRDRHAMTRTLTTYGVDVVVNWSLCHETFSFSTLEGLAVGAYLPVRREAGNVWPMVKAEGPEYGVALDTVLDLRLLFAGDALRNLPAERMRREIVFGNGCGSFLEDLRR